MNADITDGSVVADRYEIRRELPAAPGHRSFHAFDRDVEVEVALWVVHGDLVPDDDRRDRVVGAATLLRDVTHQHLLKLYDCGRDGAIVYITFQPNAPDPLLSSARPKTGTDVDLLHYATCVGEALEAAHAAGMVHGRLVPRDVVDVAGLVKVGGVGLYRDVDPEAAARRWAPWSQYLAPEVAGGLALSPATDVYSLGVMVAELSLGAPMRDRRETLHEIAERNADLYRVLATALAQAPERRQQAVSELLGQIDAVLAGELVPTREAHRAHTDSTVHHLSAAPGDPGDFPDEEIVGPPADVDARPTHDLGPVARRVRAAPEHRATRDLGPARPRPPTDFEPTVPHPRQDFDDLETVAESPGAHPGSPPPAAPPAGPAGKPKFVSMKPETDPGRRREPRVAPIDRPELQPKVRPLSSFRRAPSGPMGRYAPPRDPDRDRRQRWRRRLLVALVSVAALAVGGAVALLVVHLVSGDRGRDRAPAATVDAAPGPEPEPETAPVVLGADAGSGPPCPADMVLVEGDEGRYCIDRFESPGQGRLPETGIAQSEARAACVRRGRRLCTPDEWELACRGENRSSWPYGEAYRRGVCNTGSRGAIVAAGSFESCESAAGARDMSGNVAEWVAGAEARGGSALDRSDGRCSREQHRDPARSYSDVGYRCCADPR